MRIAHIIGRGVGKPAERFHGRRSTYRHLIQYPRYVFTNVYIDLRVVLDKTVFLNTLFSNNIRKNYTQQQ